MITSFHHTRSDFKLFWNVDNVIDFLLKDYDRKTKVIGSEVYKIIVTNPKSGKVLLEKNLTVVSQSIGHMRLDVSATEALALPVGTLKYSIVVTVNGKTSLLFTDRDHGPQSTLEVKHGPLPASIEPITVIRGDFTTIHGGLRAGSYAGPSELTDASNMRTFLVTGDEFTGTITFEATLSETPPSSTSGWFPAHEEEFDDFTGSRTINIEGNYSWLRMLLVETSGTLVEVLIK